MQRNQINLGCRLLEENREFLRSLYETEELEDPKRWFDRLDCSVSPAREKDSDITLEAFLGLMIDSSHIGIQIGSPIKDQIRYCAISSEKGVEIFAWVECPYNEGNYNVVSSLFKRVYGQGIESIPVHESLRQMHRQFDQSEH